MYQKSRFLKITLWLVRVFLESTEMVTRRGNHEVKSDGCGLSIEWDVRKESQWAENPLLMILFQKRKKRDWNRRTVRGGYQKDPRYWGDLLCQGGSPSSETIRAEQKMPGSQRGNGERMARSCQEAGGGHVLSDESVWLWGFASGKMSVACNPKMNSISTFITDFINRC